jgi:hypothetical protein
MTRGRRDLPPALTASTVCAAKLVGYGVAHGLDAGALVSIAGVTREVLDDPSRRIPVDCVIRLWQHVVSELAEPAVPLHVARRRWRTTI